MIMKSSKPNFLGIGAAKAGTTTIYDILKQHPQVFLPQIKEVHYFDYQSNYNKGFDWYVNTAFNDVPSNSIAIGEITPNYLFGKNVFERIFDKLGRIKIFVVLRNPIERAYSQYNMLHARGIEDLTFEEAIEKEAERIERSESDYYRYSYISQGYYAEQLPNFFEKFGKQNVKVILFEDFVREREKVITDLLEFLGVKESNKVDLNLDIKSNTAGEPRIKFVDYLLYKSELRKEIKKFIPNDGLRRRLKRKIQFLNRKESTSQKLATEKMLYLNNKFYKKDIRKLEALIDKDLSHWLD